MKFLKFLNEEKIIKDASLSQVLKTFKKFGYQILRSHNHIIIQKMNNSLSVPNHREINSKTLRKLIRDAKLNRKEFIDTYREI